jgi:hypothetical protein
MPCVIMHIPFMLSVIILSVFLPTAIILSLYAQCHYTGCIYPQSRGTLKETLLKYVNIFSNFLVAKKTIFLFTF